MEILTENINIINPYNPYLPQLQSSITITTNNKNTYSQLLDSLMRYQIRISFHSFHSTDKTFEFNKSTIETIVTNFITQKTKELHTINNIWSFYKY